MREPSAIRIPDPDTWTWEDRLPTADEVQCWQKLELETVQSLFLFGLFGVFVSACVATTPAILVFYLWVGSRPSNSDCGYMMGSFAFLFLLVLLRKVWKRRHQSNPNELRVIDLHMRDTSACHVDLDGKGGWLFVVDEARSVFIGGQCLWMSEDWEDADEIVDVAPSALRLVIGVAGDGQWSELQSQDLGPLRPIPEVDGDMECYVSEQTAGWQYGQMLGLIATPSSPAPTAPDTASRQGSD